MNEIQELEKLDGEIHRKKTEMARLADQQKILAREAALLNRRQRTRRLCTRGGMLESFLGKPERLSDEQVMSLLSLAFQSPLLQDRLNAYLAQPPPGEWRLASASPHSRKGAIIHRSHVP